MLWPSLRKDTRHSRQIIKLSKNILIVLDFSFYDKGLEWKE